VLAPRPTFLAICLVALMVGCTSHKDITETPDVQRSGILGKQFAPPAPWS
jgi:hypothetical protein